MASDSTFVSSIFFHLSHLFLCHFQQFFTFKTFWWSARKEKKKPKYTNHESPSVGRLYKKLKEPKNLFFKKPNALYISNQHKQ